MDNQHRQIKGYRELSEAEIALMNKIKEKGAELGFLIEELGKLPDETKPDPRWLAIGKTHLQEGLMALTRSIAKPTFF
jgi:hypothetical protein